MRISSVCFRPSLSLTRTTKSNCTSTGNRVIKKQSRCSKERQQCWTGIDVGMITIMVLVELGLDTRTGCAECQGQRPKT